ncbi:MAG: ABC transporter ATP-binding protein [Deltaproteobacteria bacterium]|nr:ABC transporter ATP-binding protein [Deltaproteobacteria bacterium]
MANLVDIAGLTKDYFLEGRRIPVLRGVDLNIAEGEMLSLVGPSGVGKSTFLQVLGTLDEPTTGTVHFQGVDVFSLTDNALADFRNKSIGFVFQSHYLLPEFSAKQNAMMPTLIHRMDSREAESRAVELLQMVGLGHRLDHKPGELSGGEQQRVALARALVMHPRLLLADEPTGNLDPETGEGIHRLLSDLNQRLGITCLVVTHNAELARNMRRQLRLREGRLVEESRAN